MFPAGAVGLFSTRLAPVIRASLVGYVTAGATFANHGSDERGGNALAAAPPGPARAALLSGPGGAAGCRGRVTPLDWQRPELQKQYATHFLPHIAAKIARACHCNFAAESSGANFAAECRGSHERLDGVSSDHCD